MAKHCSQKMTFHFLSVINFHISILSVWNHFCRIFLISHKYLQEIFSRRIRDITKTSFLRCIWDVLKRSQKKTSFFRCIWDVLKASQKRRLFWDVSERSLRCLSQWRSDWGIPEASHAGWVGTFLIIPNFLRS